MVIFCSLPVPLSFALTLTIPFASISNVTSICGIPLGAGAIPSSVKFPNGLLSAAISLSPCTTLIVTAGWLSSAVEKTWLFFVGIVVFFSINFVETPPRVSIPNDKGVTSNNKTSLTSPCSTPPCIAAPIATTSSGFTPLWGSLPKKSCTNCWTLGIRVIPPTKITSSIPLADSSASLSAVLQGTNVFWIKSSTRDSSFALVILMFKCLGPLASAVMNGKLMSVCTADDSSHLAFSADSLTRCNARLSFVRSTPCSFLNSSQI